MKIFQIFRAQRGVIFLFCLLYNCSFAQPFYFGADMSYVNEMEDCGAIFKENQIAQDPYAIFQNHGCNLVRLRLWHTPKWYDGLNSGARYSDFDDIKKAISRAKQHQMKVLLDFHLSDNWADPSKQLVPDAWLPVVDQLEVLKDSLYNYLYRSLSILNQENLLPDMIQIGNETNKGILLSPQDNEVYTLEWARNAALFNHAIMAVRDFEMAFNKDVEIMLHVAGPEDSEWLINEFVAQGVTDFDVIGISYYWAWHMPKSIEDAGDVIRNFKVLYPEKEVIIVETGYIWTNESNDSAGNIISQAHPDYQPVNPTNQRDWLIDLTTEVIDAGGQGVVYWEPCWVSTNCFTQWGQGSHQEHAAFFDFDNELLMPGGIEWMSHDYGLLSNIKIDRKAHGIEIIVHGNSGEFTINQLEGIRKILDVIVVDSFGKIIIVDRLNIQGKTFEVKNVPPGNYFISVSENNQLIYSKKMTLTKNN